MNIISFIFCVAAAILQAYAGRAEWSVVFLLFALMNLLLFMKDMDGGR